MIRIAHGALRDALPAPSELSAPTAAGAGTPEQLRLAPLEGAPVGPGPWRAWAAPVASVGDPLFQSLGRRALEVRSGAAAAQDGQLRSQLDAVMAMPERLGQLAALTSHVARERGRWLRV
jgi:hypothetical protein